MKLRIQNKERQPLGEFCEIIIREMKREVFSKLNMNKLTIIEKYLNENDIITFMGTKRFISIISILQLAFNNFEIKDNGTYLDIEINSNIKIYGTDTKLISIVKLIEYGTNDLKPYNIFRQAFDRIDINDLYNKYLNGEI